MNLDKQKIVMSILDTGIYEADVINGLVYAFRKRGKVLLKTNKLPTLYEQITLFKGRCTGVKVVCYIHQVIYLAKNGLFDPELEIDHDDRDITNNRGANLIAKTPKQNINNRNERSYYPVVKTIRAAEIAKIKELLVFGNSHASIARQLGLERLSVRYTIKRIEAGLPLKYE